MMNSSFKTITARLTGNRFKILPGLLLVAALATLAVQGVQPVLAAHAFVSINDVDGANDQPNQKDLTKLEVDDTHAGLVYVNWNWDELTGFSGANTGDACSLWDTDGDGLVNYALCVTIQDDSNGVPVQTSASPRLYSCSESPASVADQRCTNSVLIAGPYQSTSTVVSPSATDPFPAGDNYPDDTRAITVFDFDDIGGTEANLLNVCSYPSQIPNSDPSDCVVTPGAGFLTIVKVADPDDGTEFVFNASAAALGGATSWSINGSGDVQLIPYAPTTTLDLNEVIPSGWDLDSASCEIQTAIPTATGTETATGVDNLTIQSGLETICTFDDVIRPQVKVVKDLVPSSDSGLFNLSIDGTDYVTDGGDGADTGFQDLEIGDTPTVGETAGTGTDLGDYESSISCDNGDSGSGTSLQLSALAAGDQVTCTITNTARGSIVVVKNTIGGDGTFDFTSSTLGNFSLTTSGGTDQTSFNNLTPGTYDVAETDPSPAFDLTSATCDDGSDPSSIDLSAGETVTCTFENTKRGSIVVVKNTIGGDGTFSYLTTSGPDTALPANFNLATSSNTASTTFSNLKPGSYSVTETDPAPDFDFTSLSCTDPSGGTSTSGRTANIGLAAGETVTCTFTNTERGTATVIKTFQGQAITGSETFEFQLRQGASTLSEGTVLDAKVANSSNGGTIAFEVNGTTKLVPGDYQLCEFIMPGWDSTIRTMAGAFVPNSLSDPATTDNAYVCIPFTLDAGEDEVFNIDNTPPPGGMAKTIGFWKNWSSCSGGNQDPILDETLASFPGGSVLIGDLFVDECIEATRLLNKSRVDNGKKMANDAAYELAAQLLAAKLNIQAGAGACTAATDAIDDGQALLDDINFLGNKGYLGPKVKGPLLVLRNQALALAETLDQYNNNLLCP